MLKQIKIGSKLIGEGQPILIIAEAGVNHNGSLETAKKLVDAAKKAGADFVKFQSFKTDKLLVKNAPLEEYQKQSAGQDAVQDVEIRKLELNAGQQKELFAYCEQVEMPWLSTAFDEQSADLLEELGAPAFKIGSGEATHWPLLKHIAQKHKPIILSTGACALAEVGEAVEVIRKQGNNQIILLHCVSNYPADIKYSNLRAMPAMRKEFGLPVGWSDHTFGLTAPIAAVALGALVIEKHFTLSRAAKGFDHKASLEPQELAQMIKAIRNVEKALGDGIKKPTPIEDEEIALARRSIVPDQDIPAGTVIMAEMLAVKRPGSGLQPKYWNQVIGKKPKTDLKRDQLITWQDLE